MKTPIKVNIIYKNKIYRESFSTFNANVIEIKNGRLFYINEFGLKCSRILADFINGGFKVEIIK